MDSQKSIRVLVWNTHSASKESEAAWAYFRDAHPSIALLQEVVSIPDDLEKDYSIVYRKASWRDGSKQNFGTAILARDAVVTPISLESEWDWVNEELKLFEGNLVAAEVQFAGRSPFKAMSVHSPHWPVPKDRLTDVDITEVKLKHSPELWVTELMWAALHNQLGDVPWIIAGDLNSSVTIDTMWPNGPHGNQEIQDRMSSLGFVECLRESHGRLVPTFKNTKGGKIIHQMDHLFATQQLYGKLRACNVGDAQLIFGESISDHLPIIADFEL